MLALHVQVDWNQLHLNEALNVALFKWVYVTCMYVIILTGNGASELATDGVPHTTTESGISDGVNHNYLV